MTLSVLAAILYCVATVDLMIVTTTPLSDLPYRVRVTVADVSGSTIDPTDQIVEIDDD